MTTKKDVEERHVMKDYWSKPEPTVEGMMLDSNARKIDEKERPEILGMLPTVHFASVLELGAGIGRFTGALATNAEMVTAVDFIDKFIQRNKEANKDATNVAFQCGDVLDMDVQKGSIDLIFSNWLLMYLGDEEVKGLVANMIGWLAMGGFFFFRESCFHQSGDSARSTNPTHYRNPQWYVDVMRSVSDDLGAEFKLVVQKSVHAYVETKRNQNQVCWLWQKVPMVTPSPRSAVRFRSAVAAMETYKSEEFQKFLDSQQYSLKGILTYEKFFGNGFVSTGGIVTTQEFCKMLHLKSGQRVLDVGCGIGGSAIHMARTYGVQVYGVDLSTNMINIAIERTIDSGLMVDFEICDITLKDFPDNSFDVIYSRDVILHIADKLALFKRFLRWLKPSGRLLISDYCQGAGKHSEEFTEYVKQRGYHLMTPCQYGQLLEESGFTDVIAEDRTWQFVDMLNLEDRRIEEMKDQLFKDGNMSEVELEHYREGWRRKMVRCANQEQKWGLFRAAKPVPRS